VEQHRENGNPLRVVVVGAGIVGASIAYHLARRQVAVTVLERQQPGAGASSHSFAWLNAFGKDPVTYHDLNRRSMDAWQRFARSLGCDIGLHWGGEMRWVRNAEDAKGLRHRIAQLQAWGYPNRLIDATEMQQFEPGLCPGTVSAASFGALDGHVEPLKVIAACLQQARTQQAAVYPETPALGLHLQSASGLTQRVQAVQTPQGEMDCDAVVLAGGVETTPLAAMAGVHIPQQESPGVVVRTDPRPPVLQNVSVLHTPPIDAQHPEIHIRQMADGTLQIGEGTQESLSRNDSQAHADDVLKRACHYLPALTGARALPVAVGYRPMPLDGLPVLGFTQAVPNLYIALMHSGVTLAPLVGELAAMEIVDGTRVELLNVYRPERFKA
jgi:glycine/D-amino acid oxidase-like deaminating enzyme